MIYRLAETSSGAREQPVVIRCPRTHDRGKSPLRIRLSPAIDSKSARSALLPIFHYCPALWHDLRASTLLHTEALERLDEAHRSGASGCFKQLRRALHDSGGDRDKSISLRRLRAGRSCRGNTLLTGRVVQGEFGQLLTYLTYIFGNARNKAVMLPTPDEFATLSTASAGRCAL